MCRRQSDNRQKNHHQRSSTSRCAVANHGGQKFDACLCVNNLNFHGTDIARMDGIPRHLKQDKGMRATAPFGRFAAADAHRQSASSQI